MENRVEEAYIDRYDELAHRISDAQSEFEFRDALQDMQVYLTAQQEIAAMLEVFSMRDSTHQHYA